MPHRYARLSSHFVNLILSRSNAFGFGACWVSWVLATICWWFRWKGSGEWRWWQHRLNRRRTHWRLGVQEGSWSACSTRGFGSWRSHACGPQWLRQGTLEIERKFRSSQQVLERDFELERVGLKMEKTTIVVVLVIGVMSSRYWAMEARVRKTERVTVRMEAQVRESVCVKVRE